MILGVCVGTNALTNTSQAGSLLSAVDFANTFPSAKTPHLQFLYDLKKKKRHHNLSDVCCAVHVNVVPLCVAT